MGERLCRHCRSAPGIHRWDGSPCAASRRFAAWLCTACDLELNRMVLEFFAVRERTRLLEEYTSRDEGTVQRPMTKPDNITSAQAKAAVKAAYRKHPIRLDQGLSAVADASRHEQPAAENFKVGK